MDRNLLLAFALSFLVLTTWSMWQEAQLEEKGPGGRIQRGSEGASRSAEPARAPARVEEFPALPETLATPAAGPPVSTDELVLAADGREIAIERPLYYAVLNTVGARIQRWELREWRDREGARVVLLDESFGGGAVTPFVELERGNLAGVEWTLVEESAERVAFHVQRDGVTVRKIFEFPQDGYVFRVRLEVENGSGGVVAPAFAMRWPAREREGSDFREQTLSVLHDGGVQSELLAGLGQAGFFGDAPERYEFLGEVDWAGSNTPYFLSALFPDSASAASARFVPRELGLSAVVDSFFSPVELPVGQQAVREYRVYVGPKEPRRLQALGAGAIQSIDLGWSWVAPLTQMFGWLLGVFYGFVGNYGVSIVLITILVRVVTLPLTMKQMKSMERMRRLQPKIKELQAKHSEDRQKQSEAMMSLYKQEKVNPLGGCFPMVLQLPVFIGLFYALRSSIQLRQAPFFGWIDDLSAPEELFVIPGLDLPVRVLPLLMGASMVLQQKITPMQVDPAQQRMMMIIMPIMMTVLFYQFPSGLVLYWMISNVLAISHQLWVGRGMQQA